MVTCSGAYNIRYFGLYLYVALLVQLNNKLMEIAIKKSRTTYDILFSSFIIITGLVTCALAQSGAITLMGVFFIVMGIICWLILKSGYSDTSTMQKLTKVELYFPVEHKSSILDAVLNEPQKLDKFPSSKMNSLKLDLYYNDDDVYMQLFEYIPCSYKPCTKVIKHEAFDLRKLVR